MKISLENNKENIKIENNKIITNKVINNNTSIIDNNIIESPLFISSKKEIKTIGQLEHDYNISNGVKRVLGIIKENFNKSPVPIECDNIPVVYKVWEDSRGFKRELLITSSIPDMNTMNVWNGLIGLYIQKIAPIYFDTNSNLYDINSDEIEFTLYELAKFMNISTGGANLDILMKEIIRLSDAKYYSFANGVIFDKKNDKYLKSKTKSFSLVTDCELDSEKRVKGEKVKTKCKIQFNRLIIDNIRYEYIKYINPKEYFSLPSRGFTRRLYTYLKGNSHLSNGQKCKYIKRSFEVIRNKLSIYEHQSSKIKERLRTPLKNLKKYDIISDYFFGDEILINGVKERCIYFIFEGTKEEIIEKISFKKLEKSRSKKSNFNAFKLELPKDLYQFVIDKGFGKLAAKQFLDKHNKWDIIKYILWLQEKEFENKKSVRNFPGLLRFALESGSVDLEKTHKHIVNFVEEEKSKYETLKRSKEDSLKQTYEKYIKDEIIKFKKEDEAAYEILLQTILDNINASYDKRMSEFKLFDSQITESEREKWEAQKQKWIEFKKKQVNSKLFHEQFEKSIISLRNLKLYEDFKDRAN